MPNLGSLTQGRHSRKKRGLERVLVPNSAKFISETRGSARNFADWRLKGEVGFVDPRMRGAVAAEESGRAAKRGKQLDRLVSTASNRSASAPERKAIDGDQLPR
jgi:hypothetical protein